ncbi:hypothetical protein D3C85_1749410 [compost metagenome]
MQCSVVFFKERATGDARENPWVEPRIVALGVREPLDFNRNAGAERKGVAFQGRVVVHHAVLCQPGIGEALKDELDCL